MPLSTDLLALLSLFNRQKTDLPDGVLHKDCVFRLNGRAYHETLGRPAADPLVRLFPTPILAAVLGRDPPRSMRRR